MIEVAYDTDEDFGLIEQSPDTFRYEDLESVESIRYQEHRKRNSFLRTAETLVTTAESFDSIQTIQESYFELVTYYIDHDFPAQAIDLLRNKVSTETKIDVFSYALASDNDCSIDILRELFSLDEEVAEKCPVFLGKLAAIKISHGISVNENLQIIESLKKADDTDKALGYRAVYYQEAFPALRYFYAANELDNFAKLAQNLSSYPSPFNNPATLQEILDFENARNEDGLLPAKKLHKVSLKLFNGNGTVSIEYFKMVIGQLDHGNPDAIWEFNRIALMHPKNLARSVCILYELMGGASLLDDMLGGKKVVEESNDIKTFKNGLKDNPMDVIRIFDAQRTKKTQDFTKNFTYLFERAMILARTFAVDPREEDFYGLLGRIELLTQTIPSDKDRLIRSKNILGQIELLTDTNSEFLAIMKESLEKLDKIAALHILIELLPFTETIDEVAQNVYKTNLIKVFGELLQERTNTNDITSDVALFNTLVELHYNNYLSLEEFRKLLLSNRSKLVSHFPPPDQSQQRYSA